MTDKLNRRDFLRASAGGAGAILAASAAPAFARVAPGHCGWGAFAEPHDSQTAMQAIFQMENLINTLEANVDEPINERGNDARMSYGDRYTVQFLKEDGAWKLKDLD